MNDETANKQNIEKKQQQQKNEKNSLRSVKQTSSNGVSPWGMRSTDLSGNVAEDRCIKGGLRGRSPKQIQVKKRAMASAVTGQAGRDQRQPAG